MKNIGLVATLALMALPAIPAASRDKAPPAIELKLVIYLLPRKLISLLAREEQEPCQSQESPDFCAFQLPPPVSTDPASVRF